MSCIRNFTFSSSIVNEEIICVRERKGIFIVSVTLKSEILTAPFFPAKSFHVGEKKVAKWLLTSSFPFLPILASPTEELHLCFPSFPPSQINYGLYWVPKLNGCHDRTL
jgi:hypothetical protein